MTQRSRYPAKVPLVLGLVAGLAACGGGGGSPESGQGEGQKTTTTVIHAQEITITPPASRSPQTVGTISAQTLREGGNALNVDVAPYFSDPDDDPLTYSAVSSDPDIVRAAISGSTLTITPVSDGTATVTVTAGDGDASVRQTVSATVQERQDSSSTPTADQRQPDRPTPPPREPEIALTGIDIQVRRGGRRSATLGVSPDPGDARLDHIILDAGPHGTFRYYTRTGNTRYIGFNCSGGFKGDATITIWIPDGTIRASVAFACR